MKVLLIAPNVDGTDVGEAYVAFKWAEALADKVDLTLLSFERPGRRALAEQLPGVRVVTWPEPAIVRRHERLNAMLKPAWPMFARKVTGWLKAALSKGERFDLTHQLMPLAARYASPLRRFDLPYLIGPLGGTLDMPEAFKTDAGPAPLFTRLRALDALRFRWDPSLRASYAKAACILGVAPYVKDLLGPIRLKRFEPMLELGIDAASELPRPARKAGHLRLLHVGRAVRTKGLRDAVRALAHLKDLPEVTLTSAGGGAEIARCKALAEQLGVADRVSFLGQQPRARIEDLYRAHDLFLFPSFREPTGGVLYEAMRNALPIVTAARGGPDFIVDDTCGFRIPVTTPDQFAKDIATQIRHCAGAPELMDRLGRQARAKVAAEGLWPVKAARLVSLYQEILHQSSERPYTKG